MRVLLPAAARWSAGCAALLLIMGCSSGAPDPSVPSTGPAVEGPDQAEAEPAGEPAAEGPAEGSDEETAPEAEAEPESGSESDAAPESGSESASAPEAAEPEPEPAIQDVDFAQLEWTDWVNEVVLVPAEGIEGYTFEVREDIVYADVNGDGHQDALVALGQTEERWFEDIWYIWAWDPEAQQPYQASGPVARAADCGDRIESVSAAEGAFIIHEQLWPQGADVVCAQVPPVEITRHIVLEDGWETMVSPARGFGGMCPQILGTDDGWPVDDLVLHTAPDETSSVVGDPEPAFFIEADVWPRPWLHYPHWMLVHLGFSNPADGPAVMPNGYTPCGWAYLEVDDRPVPHMPYTD